MTTNRTIPQSTGAGVIAALLAERGVIVFWIVYGVTHALFRFSYSGSLALDDSRASELVQSLALGYEARQPPLYQWLLWCSQEVMGTGIQSHLLVRYLLIAALGYAVFAATRPLVRDQRLAALASLSLSVGYHLGWTFHEWGTQSLLLSVAGVWTFDAARRFIAQPSLRCAVWLGVAIGIGILSKHSYALLLAGLVLAATSLPDLRPRLRDARLLISVALALVLMSPYLIWLIQVGGNVIASSGTALIEGKSSHLMRAAIGLAKLAWALPGFLLPWIAFVVIFAPSAFAPAHGAATPASAAERLALRTMAAAALLAAIGIVVVGATNIGERYMHAILIIAPVYLFARIDRVMVAEKRILGFATFVVAGAVAIFGIRFLSIVDTGISKPDPYHTLVPYAQLSKQLTARGLDHGTALTPSIHVAGNLHAFLPDLRVITPTSFRLERPPRRAADDRSCFLIWPEGREWLARGIVPLKGLKRERIVVDAPRSILGRRPATWWLVRLDPRSKPCA